MPRKKPCAILSSSFGRGWISVNFFARVLCRLNPATALLGWKSIFRAGFKEFSRLRQQAGVDPEAVMEGAQRAMRVATSREEEQMDKHLPFLATVGSTSPYVGLFGTVWGIMTSFQGLATMHQATLATVAPGISEALVATAMGLFAAIPAVVAYNRYSARVEILLNKYETFGDEFYSILHRQAYSSAAASSSSRTTGAAAPQKSGAAAKSRSTVK